MVLKFCLLSILATAFSSLFAAGSVDTSNVYRQQLQQLLMQRDQKFSSYSQSLQERSGIFGNKTKKDILRSNEVLIDLVKTDNNIIEVLNRVVDFRNYEKVSMTYNNLENQQHLDNLLQATDTLSKQVKVLRSTNDELKAKNRRLWWLVSFIFAVVLFVVISRLRKKYFLGSDLG